MIGMRVRDHNHVCFRNAGIVTLAPGVHMNYLAGKFQHDAAVKNGCDAKRPSGCLDLVGLPGGGASHHGSERKQNERESGKVGWPSRMVHRNAPENCLAYLTAPPRMVRGRHKTSQIRRSLSGRWFKTSPFGRTSLTRLR